MPRQQSEHKSVDITEVHVNLGEHSFSSPTIAQALSLSKAPSKAHKGSWPAFQWWMGHCGHYSQTETCTAHAGSSTWNSLPHFSAHLNLTSLRGIISIVVKTTESATCWLTSGKLLYLSVLRFPHLPKLIELLQGLNESIGIKYTGISEWVSATTSSSLVQLPPSSQWISSFLPPEFIPIVFMPSSALYPNSLILASSPCYWPTKACTALQPHIVYVLSPLLDSNLSQGWALSLTCL